MLLNSISQHLLVLPHSLKNAPPSPILMTDELSLQYRLLFNIPAVTLKLYFTLRVEYRRSERGGSRHNQASMDGLNSSISTAALDDALSMADSSLLIAVGSCRTGGGGPSLFVVKRTWG